LFRKPLQGQALDPAELWRHRGAMLTDSKSDEENLAREGALSRQPVATQANA
jgi:hypothetical protein